MRREVPNTDNIRQTQGQRDIVAYIYTTQSTVAADAAHTHHLCLFCQLTNGCKPFALRTKLMIRTWRNFSFYSFRCVLGLKCCFSFLFVYFCLLGFIFRLVRSFCSRGFFPSKYLFLMMWVISKFAEFEIYFNRWSFGFVDFKYELKVECDINCCYLTNIWNEIILIMKRDWIR